MSTAPIISVYGGSRLLGYIRERDREHIARTRPQDIFLGWFRSRREAVDAISATQRSRNKTARSR